MDNDTDNDNDDDDDDNGNDDDDDDNDDDDDDIDIDIDIDNDNDNDNDDDDNDNNKELPFPCVTFFPSMASVIDTLVDHAGTWAARRRRERRLRAYLQYARMSVAMALAEANHHTAPRGQKAARAEAMNDTSKAGVAGDAVYFETLFDEDPQGCADRSGRAAWAFWEGSAAEHADEICPFSRCSCAAVWGPADGGAQGL